MPIIVLHKGFEQWENIPSKMKDIAIDVGYNCKRHCQDYMELELVHKVDSDFTFFCRKFPMAGTNGVLRIVEMMNHIYQFDPYRDIIPFAEETSSGFLFRCCWNTHSMNKKYRQDAMTTPN